MKKIFLLITVASACCGFFISCTKKNDDPNSPLITAVIPASARGGDTISVIGENLPSDLSAIKISINDKPVKIISVTPELIKLVVPALGGSGKVMITVGSDTYEGPEFTYDYKVIVSTLAGDGTVGTSNGQGQAASFYCPWGITADAGGNLFVADCYNRLIRKVTPEGTVSSYSIPFFSEPPYFYSPYNIAIDPATRNLYVTDFNEHLLRMEPSGEMKVIFTDEMPLTGIAVSPDGQYLYVSNNTRGTITKLNIDGTSPTLFSSGLITPRNIIFNNTGKMYVAACPFSVYSVSATGVASEKSIDSEFQGWEIATDTAGNFYLADHVKNRIRKIDRNGHVTTIAGNGEAADVDGIGLEASFDGPQGITIDAQGNLYVTTFNYATNTGNKIRKIVFE